MNKISLFGGTGFIGGRYAREYSDEAFIEPRVIGIYKASKFPNILYFISTIHNYHVFEDGMGIFKDVHTNLITFLEILKQSHEVHKENVIFNLISTWFTYGSTELPAKETSPCNPTGFYSITARAREQLLISYCETFGLKWRILRLGNVIGIGDKKISRKKNALQYMIRELAQGREIELYQNGAIRDFIDVRDCIRAIHLVLEKGELNQIYNISNGSGLNVKDLVYIAWQEAGYTGIIKDIPVPDFHRVVQTPKMWMDTKKLKSLGYVQQHDIKQSVRELVHYYQHENG